MKTLASTPLTPCLVSTVTREAAQGRLTSATTPPAPTHQSTAEVQVADWLTTSPSWQFAVSKSWCCVGLCISSANCQQQSTTHTKSHLNQWKNVMGPLCDKWPLRSVMMKLYSRKQTKRGNSAFTLQNDKWCVTSMFLIRWHPPLVSNNTNTSRSLRHIGSSGSLSQPL